MSMNSTEDKLRANREDRIKAAMARYATRASGRQRPLLRRKNVFIRGRMEIMGGHVPPPPSIFRNAKETETAWSPMRGINMKISNSEREAKNG